MKCHGVLWAFNSWNPKPCIGDKYVGLPRESLAGYSTRAVPKTLITTRHLASRSAQNLAVCGVTQCTSTTSRGINLSTCPQWQQATHVCRTSKKTGKASTRHLTLRYGRRSVAIFDFCRYMLFFVKYMRSCHTYAIRCMRSCVTNIFDVTRVYAILFHKYAILFHKYVRSIKDIDSPYRRYLELIFATFRVP